MRHRSLSLLALAAACSATVGWAAPPAPGGSGAWPPGHGRAAPYRTYHAPPVYRVGWYGQPRYYGYGLGYGYGTGWSVSVGWPWYWPAYGAGYWPGYWPSYGPAYWGTTLMPAYPYGAVVGTWPTPLVGDDLVYVQQPPAATSPPQPGRGHWYYCTEPAGYFPDVKECSRPWVPVQPSAPTNGR
jgi:hypothetical protein